MTPHSPSDDHHHAPLPPDLEEISSRLDRLGETERGAAPVDLRDSLVRSRPIPPTRVFSPVRWRTAPMIRAAAAVALLVTATAVTWWALGTSPTEKTTSNAITIDLDAEIELLEADGESDWLASDSDLEALDRDLATLDASLDDLWLDFDDPLAEDSL